MLRTGAISLLIVGMLSACGHTPQERAASGALIGGAIGAVVALASEPDHGGYDDYYESDRHYDRDYHRPRHRHHGRHGGRRRYRHDGPYEYYD